MIYCRAVLFLILFMPWVVVNALNLDVDIIGVEGELLINTQAHLSIYNESKRTNSLNLTRIQQLHKEATAQIELALQPYGYYQVKVNANLIFIDSYKELDFETDINTGIDFETETTIAGSWLASYDIELGEGVRVSQLNIELSGSGKLNKKIKKLVSDFSLKVNDVLVHSHYEDLKQSFRAFSQNTGYLNAKFIRNEIRVDLEAYNAQIFIHYDTGEQYRFGTLIFKQKKNLLSEDFLRRYVTFKPGDRYSTKLLLKLQADLSGSDYFDRIEVHPLIENAENLHVPIEVIVIARKPRRYKFGIGYGTDSGIRASIVHQRLLGKKGHALSLKAKVSQHLNRVDLMYLMPMRQPASEQFIMNTHYLIEETESRLTKSLTLDFRLSKGKSRWRQEKALTYEREDYEVADEIGFTQLILPNFSVTRSLFDDRIFPKKGSRLAAELWLSHTFWYSDSDFLQVRLNGKWVYPLGEKTRLLFRVETGATLVDGISDLPASRRFYAGGDQSIRGYGYEELGPLDENGDVLGGKYLGVASIEYEFSFKTNWGVAVFFDVGNGFNDFSEKIYRGAGIGIRWRSVVGPIRFDFGWPLDKEVDYPRFHLIIGLDL